jgi:hypothetical protein
MKKAKLIRLFKKFHKWPGIVISFFAIIYALSGIVLNHRETFSSFDIPRKLMPPGYQYKNWNLAAVRGSLEIGNDSILIYGNIGIWLTNNQFDQFEDFNHGFPKGIDKRKIYSLKPMGSQVVAATHFGLYVTDKNEVSWNKIPLPVKEERVADLTLKDDTLIILTRNHMVKTGDLHNMHPIKLPVPIGYEGKIGLFNTLWELHSGELFGMAGRLFVDLLGIVIIWLSVSGLLHFFYPKWIKRRKEKKISSQRLVSAKRWNLHWHNVIGYLAIIFLIINTIAGMFLRPPLLIPIASKKVGIIPYTHLDNNNAWHDKLRRIHWNDSLNIYLLSTSEGFYLLDESLSQPPVATVNQPPVSVMGLNVLEPISPDTYLLGSFTGMYAWNIRSGALIDFITGKPATLANPAGRPIGAHMVAGWIKSSEAGAFWFDYNHGATALSPHTTFPQMSAEMVTKTPTSWWNAALEIHTGRIFEHLIGPFYILIVPLVGLCILIVLISGFFIWWMAYRKNTPKSLQKNHIHK